MPNVVMHVLNANKTGWVEYYPVPASHNHDETNTTGGWFTVKTPHGNIQLGPANGSYGHIYTDRASFYFNKELLVNGNKVYHTGNKPTASDVGASPSNHSHDWSEINGKPSTFPPSTHSHSYVPLSRTVNGKALSSNITLSASDVGAAPSNHGTHLSDIHTTNLDDIIMSDGSGGWRAVTPYWVTTGRTISAGNGLSGGGTLASNRSISLGTPGTITTSTSNSVSTGSHTHALTLTKSDITSALGYTPPTSNTHRDITSSLTSTSTTVSLSASAGKTLKDLVDGKANKSHGTHLSDFYSTNVDEILVTDGMGGWKIVPPYWASVNHSHTKSDVGLSNVLNYGIASISAAEAGNSNSDYMTPARTKQAINSQRGIYTSSSAYNYDFPIGSYIVAHTGSTNITRNSYRAIYTDSVYTYGFEASGSNQGTLLTGSWRARGYAGTNSGGTRYYLFQRAL